MVEAGSAGSAWQIAEGRRGLASLGHGCGIAEMLDAEGGDAGFLLRVLLGAEAEGGLLARGGRNADGRSENGAGILGSPKEEEMGMLWR